MRMKDVLQKMGYEPGTIVPDIRHTAFADPEARKKCDPGPVTDRIPVTPEVAIIYYNKLGYDFDFTEFVNGMNVELEHDDITQGNLEMTAKIVAAHLREISNYYTLLKKHVEKKRD